MNKLICMMSAGIFLLLSAEQASAQHCMNPFNCAAGDPIFKRLFVKQPLPAFQAAPWYLYWPYNGHFMTPAPLGLGAGGYGAGGGYGGGYGAGGYGAGGGNPYFPQYGGGYGPYGK